MPDLSDYPARVTRAVAMELLCVNTDRAFKKVVDANPRLRHKLPGETRWRYLREEIARLLSPNAASRAGVSTQAGRPSVCDPRGRKSKP